MCRPHAHPLFELDTDSADYPHPSTSAATPSQRTQHTAPAHSMIPQDRPHSVLEPWSLDIRDTDTRQLTSTQQSIYPTNNTCVSTLERDRCETELKLVCRIHRC